MNLRAILAAALTAGLGAIVVVGLVVGPAGDSDRVTALANRLKCPQCQGESVADSPALMARTMRTIISERVAAGQTDEQIEDFFVGLYGPTILLDPGLSVRNIALWAVPAAVLVGGVAMVVDLQYRRRRELELASEPVTEEAASVTAEVSS